MLRSNNGATPKAKGDDRISRRQVLKTLGLSAAASYVPWTSTTSAQDAAIPRSPNDRWRIGVIGLRYQGSVIARESLAFGDIVAICDVDRHVREQARASFNSSASIHENYIDLLANPKVDVVLIATPDHWHAKMVIDACRAGKDVYCEKPLTLTVDEGTVVQRVARESGRIVQVGSWQRSDARFRLAAEMVQAGRIGSIKKVTVLMSKNTVGGPFPVQQVPKHFNWNLWQGQTPDVPYIPERSHYTFRWWYEYSGGEMTDSGAHHLDIAQWAIGMQNWGPTSIEGTATYPVEPNSFNVATTYRARYRYQNGIELEVIDRPSGIHNRDGIMFEGDNGHFFVNRSGIYGVPVQDLANRPLTRSDFHLYAHDNLSRPERMGKIDAIKNHMGNFYDCTLTRQSPVSDVVSQHRSASLCHLGNIAQRIGRRLEWNPETEQFIDAPDATRLLAREQRKGFEVV